MFLITFKTFFYIDINTNEVPSALSGLTGRVKHKNIHKRHVYNIIIKLNTFNYAA
jgi:hypothetical protein